MAEDIAELVVAANELSSRVLDTYRGRGQPKVQIEMASLLRRLAAEAGRRAEVESDPGLIDRLRASSDELEDLRNQMLDFGFKVRKFTPADQLRTKLADAEARADAAEKRIADALEYAGSHFLDWGDRAESVYEILTGEASS